MVERDPYALTQEETKKIKDEDKVGTGGILCPKRNVSLEGTCYACKTLQKVYAAHVRGDKMWQLANRKNSKAGYFICAVLKENPSKAVLLELFMTAGNAIVDKVEAGEWTDISILQNGKGRDVRISKVKDSTSGYNKYPVEAMLEKADWSVDESVIDTLPHFGNKLKGAQEALIDIIKNGTFPILKISSLKIDTSITFRVVRRPGEAWYVPLYRHWGNVTQAEVDGEVELDMEIMERPFSEEDKKDLPWENNDKSDDKPKEKLGESQPQPDLNKDKQKNPACFGMENFFDINDPRCKENCFAYTECGKKALH